VIIDGRDISEDPVGAKQVTGFIPDRGFLYEKLTGIECLQFVASIYGMDHGRMESRINELVTLFEMDKWAGDLIESYSHGMKQRLVMSAALLHEPKVIVVDEPMVGLDPKYPHAWHRRGDVWSHRNHKRRSADCGGNCLGAQAKGRCRGT